MQLFFPFLYLMGTYLERSWRQDLEKGLKQIFMIMWLLIPIPTTMQI